LAARDELVAETETKGIGTILGHQKARHEGKSAKTPLVSGDERKVMIPCIVASFMPCPKPYS